MRVCVIGLWHLGSVTSACLANHGFDVIGYDNDKSVVENLMKGNAPIFEPGLDALVCKNLEQGNLSYTNDLQNAISECDFIFLTIDTPVNENDEVDLTTVYQYIDQITNYAKNKVTIIVQSQVPVGTCDDLIEKIKGIKPGLSFGLAYCPENLRLGKAIEIFENPDRLIIGADKNTANNVISFFSFLNCPKIQMDLKSAEMTKHSINSFLAMNISFINWIAMICEIVGADARKVSEGLITESRIGDKLPLKPGLGFAGGTLGRDLRVLEKICTKTGISSELVHSIFEINHKQNTVIVKKLLKIFQSLKGLTIGVLGLTYKPGTDTLRRSSSIEIISELLLQNAKVKAYDPAIKKVNSLHNENFSLSMDPYVVAKDADALIIYTDWPQFKELNYSKICSMMKQPLIFDMKNFLDGNTLTKIGFNYNGTRTKRQ